MSEPVPVAGQPIDVASLIGQRDIVLLTFDALRYDVAQSAWQRGDTPNLAGLLPKTGWQERHTPATFTLPAHLSFLSGFLPTPVDPRASARQPRLFAARFERARRINEQTFVYDEADLPSALATRGYRTACFGGVGFFSGETALGSVLPSLFAEHFYSRATSVYEPGCPTALFTRVAGWLASLPSSERSFALINVAATHSPTHFYLPGARTESAETQAAALHAVDQALPTVLDALRARGNPLLIACSDHGTLFGENGFRGHGFAHPLVWRVPYLETIL